MRVKIEQRSNSIILDWVSSSEFIQLKTDDDVLIYEGKARKTIPIGDKVSGSQFINLYVVQGELTLYVSKIYYRSEDDPVQINTQRESQYFYMRLKDIKRNKIYLSNMKTEIKELTEGVTNGTR